MKIAQITILSLAALGLARRAPAAMIADGVQSGVTSTTWLTAGDATLGGQTTGFDWSVSAKGNVVFVSSGGQGTVAGSTTEWPAAGTQSAFGVAGGYTVGLSNLSGASSILISVVVPAAAEYTVFGTGLTTTTQFSTAPGQILQWTDTTPSTATHYSVVASTGGTNNGGNVGAVGFSAVPEPASLGIFLTSAVALLARRQRGMSRSS